MGQRGQCRIWEQRLSQVPSSRMCSRDSQEWRVTHQRHQKCSGRGHLLPCTVNPPICARLHPAMDQTPLHSQFQELGTHLLLGRRSTRFRQGHGCGGSWSELPLPRTLAQESCQAPQQEGNRPLGGLEPALRCGSATLGLKGFGGGEPERKDRHGVLVRPHMCHMRLRKSEI